MVFFCLPQKVYNIIMYAALIGRKMKIFVKKVMEKFVGSKKSVTFAPHLEKCT